LAFTLIENGVNLGIAAALNTGVRWAKARGFQYVLLFDQDSTVTEGFSQAMLAQYESHPQRDKVAVVTPSQVERSTGRARGHRFAKDGSPLVAITSGSLMPVEIFDRCGWFQEELVIDCVDHEYCLRARSLGYTLAQCRQAVLLVAVGSTTSHQAFGLTISARHYSARRRYYITRNRLVMVQRFWKQQPAWCCRMLQDIVQDAVKVALVEEERWSKMRNTARGIYDALCGRMGKVVEL
jgi:rhamnosyltransferase